MNRVLRRLVIPRFLCAVAILLCCGAAFAQDTLTLLNPPNNGDNAGGVYTSPYNINVYNGVTNTPMQLVCDDFTTDISVGESWQADPTTLTDLTASSVMNLKFGNASDEPAGTALMYANPDEDYAVAAVLVAQLMTTPGLSNDQVAGYSFAIWNLFHDGLVVSPTSCGDDPYGSLTAAQCSDAYNDLTTAAGLIGSGSGGYDLNNIVVNGQSISSLTVYTPNPTSAAQEFLLVSMPEASFPAVLGADLLCVLGLIAFLRRRTMAHSKLS